MGRANCVRALLKLGVATDPRDVEGVTPLEYAKKAGHTGNTFMSVPIKSKYIIFTQMTGMSV